MQVAVACLQFVDMWAIYMYATYFTHLLLRTSSEREEKLDRGWQGGREYKKKIEKLQLTNYHQQGKISQETQQQLHPS